MAGSHVLSRCAKAIGVKNSLQVQSRPHRKAPDEGPGLEVSDYTHPANQDNKTNRIFQADSRDSMGKGHGLQSCWKF